MILDLDSTKFAVVHNIEGPGTAVFFCEFSDLGNLEFNPLLDILRVRYNESEFAPLSFEFKYAHTQEKKKNHKVYKVFELTCTHNKRVKCVILMH